MKFSQVTPNSSPALADYLMGVTSGNVDFRVTIQNLVTLILKTSLLSNPYKFRGKRTAAINATSTPAVMQCDAKDFDTSSNLDIVTNKGRFTAPIAGFYHFNTSFNEGGGTKILYLYKNGALYQRGTQAGAGGSQAEYFAQSAAGDYWEFYFSDTSTTAVDVTAGIQPVFEGFLVSAT